MNAFLLAPVAFFCLVAAMGLGVLVSRRLPAGHLDADARDVIKLATAVVGTLSALALGLLIASAKSEFEDANTELKSAVTRIVLLDRVMAHYGAETAEPRVRLRKLVERRLVRAWDSGDATVADESDSGSFEAVQQALRSLAPESEPRRLLQARALQVSGQVAEAYWLQTQALGGGLPWPFLVILVLWLSFLFGTFGLLAPPNRTVIVTLLVCAVSVSAAIYLIIDMDHPYIGFVHVSDDPLRTALAQLGRP